MVSVSFPHLLAVLFAAIAVIVLLTARFRIHAVFALFAACFIVGIGVGMPFEQTLGAIKEGFGHVMKSLAFVIIMGTVLGVMLERTGSTRVMASFILGKTGEKKAPLAMSITGFVAGLPIFCDSGYIVLSGLVKSLSARTGLSVATLAVSLATGLYSVHCLIPPHPGMSAAAAHLNIEFGRLILIGILVAAPASAVGYMWALYAGRNLKGSVANSPEKNTESVGSLPGVIQSFLPLVVPIVLIGAKPFLEMEFPSGGFLLRVISILGEPVIALLAGILLASLNVQSAHTETIGKVLSEGAEKAGGILVIIGAGGAFGAVLSATNPASHFENMSAGEGMGILLPFLIAFALKTAQGSSTVAIITASTLVFPLLPVLGMDSENGRLLAVLAMGAGSMMISHANDAYFWVISNFSGLDMRTMLRVYSVSSILMGITTLLMVYLLSAFMSI
jgi:GntP family gluconate:H+ symporter